MKINCLKYKSYVGILKEELIPAMGCTEPVSIAYASSKAREILGLTPTKVIVEVSGNIIKNVKSVVVPNTGGLKGIDSAVAAGIVAGDSSAELQVLANIKENEYKAINEYLKKDIISVKHSNNGKLFYISITVFNGNNSAKVVIADYHTNIVHIEKNNKIIMVNKDDNIAKGNNIDRTLLSVKDIIDFANSVNLDDVKDIIERQIDYNYNIAIEGIKNDYGARVGKTIIKTHGNSVIDKAKAYASAGADARMSGCEMPVIIVSGSGNQGITASVPIIVYAKEMNINHELLIRAIILSDLITIHQKTSIGRLSAFCGVVSAAVGAAAGVAYINGGSYDVISHTIVNSLAMVSGMVCDGAKPSCAAKISAAISASLLGYYMYLEGNQFYDGEGIIYKGVENTIANIGKLAHNGMLETDNEILNIMTNRSKKTS